MAERDPEAIKADIDAARDRLALTVDSLAERTNPQRLADDFKAAVLRFVKKPAVAATTCRRRRGDRGAGDPPGPKRLTAGPKLSPQPQR